MPKKRISPEELAEQQQLQKDLELATQCARLKSFQEREQALFNEFQLQRDKLNHFWIIAKKQLEDKKADLRNKEREIQASAPTSPLHHRFLACARGSKPVSAVVLFKTHPKSLFSK